MHVHLTESAFVHKWPQVEPSIVRLMWSFVRGCLWGFLTTNGAIEQYFNEQVPFHLVLD